jgi:acetylornithine deacetylase/succinyl-diaminopimelate desuccinylase-like protein
MLRSFLRSFWKTILALIILVAIASLTIGHGAENDALTSSLRRHVKAIASTEHNTATPLELERVARYVEAALQEQGYQPRRQQYSFAGHTVRNIEVSVSNVGAGQTASQVMIVGAHYDSAPGAPGADDNASGVAALIELARQLRTVRPGPRHRAQIRVLRQ